jgi:DnaJ-class molecular chaperone
LNFNIKNVPSFVKYFEFKNFDTHVDVYIDPIVAMLGGKLKIRTLAGIKELIIPKQT